ncbi:hypothetical protein BC941DRAFT_434601 [Chlamydoabsidia padenii]|nr:hypothetical protein BC941DRAFT_434601 [Chlamydoabsidia padenii]
MENPTAETKNDTTLDPNELFAQFNPLLYFDSPQKVNSRIDDNNNNNDSSTLSEATIPWYTLIEQPVPANRETFWKTVRRWTTEPQFVIPPVEKADIISTTNHGIDHTDAHPTETVVRKLVPKRKTKDQVLVETIKYYENYNEDSAYEGKVTYQPNLASSVDPLPFYYPKVLAYGFTYTTTTTDTDRGILRLQIQPLQTNGELAVIIDPKMRKALETIIHKLFKWCIQARIGYKKKAHHDSLIPKDVYLNKYQEIKTKYAGHLVRTWTEKTDPKKFVYEDIAIASYLICIWLLEEEATKRKPTFVDLGCGNGLLTYLLKKEGYQGYGVDMADRRIWERLCIGDEMTNMLKVEALYPSSVTYDVDWIIGNHADELVPWVPIIATKSGHDCKFFVIPCCMYGLDGSRNLSLMNEEGGKYLAYTNYIKNIATQCGFDCEQDYLRIPSTKNIALIGRHRLSTINQEQMQEIEAPGHGFSLRKTDREKEELRRLGNNGNNKRVKIETN